MKYKSMRDISDLRIQYFCEYRYHLKLKEGNSSTLASIRGEYLHSKVKDLGSRHSITQNPVLVVLVVSILLFLLFIMIW